MAGLFFLCICPHCHRAAEIEVRKLGRKIQCCRCGQAYSAIDRDNESAALDDPLSYWIRFTDHPFSVSPWATPDSKDLTRTPR